MRGKLGSFYTVTYACDPKNVSKARELIQRDLISMQKENVTPAELQQAKALLLRQIPLAESSEDSVAGGLLGSRSDRLAARRTASRGKAVLFDDRGSGSRRLSPSGSAGRVRTDHSGPGAAVSRSSPR